jgi:hypothetical protein
MRSEGREDYSSLPTLLAISLCVSLRVLFLAQDRLAQHGDGGGVEAIEELPRLVPLAPVKQLIVNEVACHVPDGSVPLVFLVAGHGGDHCEEGEFLSGLRPHAHQLVGLRSCEEGYRVHILLVPSDYRGCSPPRCVSDRVSI